MCAEPGWDTRLGGWCPARGSWDCALLRTQGCWRLPRDVAMSSWAIPGRVDPGFYWQEPAASTPNKQPGGHRHIPGQSLAAARASCLSPSHGVTRWGGWAAGCPRDWQHPKSEVFCRAGCGGDIPDLHVSGWGGCAWGPLQPAWLRDGPRDALSPRRTLLWAPGDAAQPSLVSVSPRSRPCCSSPRHPLPPCLLELQVEKGVLLGCPYLGSLSYIEKPCPVAGGHPHGVVVLERGGHL